MEAKEYNPREKSVDTFENVLFTKITLQNLKKTKILDLAPALMIISHVNNLDIYFFDSGMMCADNNHYKKACDILERSVMYN